MSAPNSFLSVTFLDKKLQYPNKLNLIIQVYQTLITNVLCISFLKTLINTFVTKSINT